MNPRHHSEKNLSVTDDGVRIFILFLDETIVDNPSLSCSVAVGTTLLKMPTTKDIHLNIFFIAANHALRSVVHVRDLLFKTYDNNQ